MTITIQSHYLRGAFSPAGLRERASDLKDIEFDTVVGTGLSGLLPLAVLADYFDAHYAAIRKPNDSSHAEYGLLEGTLGHRWLFVDDFVSSGATFNRALEVVFRTAEQRDHKTECVGIFEYERERSDRFKSFTQIRRMRPRIDNKWEELNAPKPQPEPLKTEPTMTVRLGDVTLTVGDPVPSVGYFQQQEGSPWTLTTDAELFYPVFYPLGALTEPETKDKDES